VENFAENSRVCVAQHPVSRFAKRCVVFVSLFSRWWWVVFRFVSFRVLITIEMCWWCLLQARAAPTVSQFAGSCSGSSEIGASDVVESGPAAVVSLCCASWGLCSALWWYMFALRAVLLCS
jgi:hypothetical protein